MIPRLVPLCALVLSLGACTAPHDALAPSSGSGSASAFPVPVERDVVLRDFHFRSGEVLPEVTMHVRTLGTPHLDAQGRTDNAVLVLHGTGGSGAQFVNERFAGELFGAGQLLDAGRYFIVLPDDLGHGKSSKPSDGLHARFPRYRYLDMVEAERRLLIEGLGVSHLRLLMGTSMGGMHTWQWGEEHPDFMDALLPLASVPTQISGRNRVWRRIIIDAIRNDPAWQNGEYASQPPSLRTAAEMLFFLGSNAVQRQTQAPTLALADAALATHVTDYVKKNDATDVLYTLEASEDYDPGPRLEAIRAPLVAINSADDLINPPELNILEHEIGRVPRGRAVMIPLSPRTSGHGTHTSAAVWKTYLADLLLSSAK